MKQRKIIQITTAGGPIQATGMDSLEAFFCIVALCDDGTIWQLTMDPEAEAMTWDPLPDVPQPDSKGLH